MPDEYKTLSPSNCIVSQPQAMTSFEMAKFNPIHQM